MITRQFPVRPFAHFTLGFLLCAAATAAFRPGERWPVALLRRRRRQHEVLAARSDQRGQRRQAEGRLDLGLARRAAAEGEPALGSFAYETTPLMVGGTLYTSTLARAGRGHRSRRPASTLWVFNPEGYKAGRPTNLGFVHRGVAYWTDGRQERLYLAAHDAYSVCHRRQDRQGRQRVRRRRQGRIWPRPFRCAVNARNYTMTSPPVICRDVVIVGSSISDGPQNKEAPRGDVQAFDVRTGKPAWIFHAIPQEGEFGNDTWENDSWKYTGNANVWTLMSADEELGYVYLPIEHADERLVRRASAGRQPVRRIAGLRRRHDRQARLAFPDRASRPVGLRPAGGAGAVRHQGRRQADQGRGADHQDRLHVRLRSRDRQAGVADRRAAGAAIDGAGRANLADAAVSDQAGAVRAARLDRRQPDRLHARAAGRGARRFSNEYDHGPLFTPPTEKGTINLPGWAGGANWWGAAFDPDTGLFYVPSISMPISVKLNKPDAARSNLTYVRGGAGVRRRGARARRACRCSSRPTAASRRST